MKHIKHIIGVICILIGIACVLIIIAFFILLLTAPLHRIGGYITIKPLIFAVISFIFFPIGCDFLNDGDDRYQLDRLKKKAAKSSLEDQNKTGQSDSQKPKKFFASWKKPFFKKNNLASNIDERKQKLLKNYYTKNRTDEFRNRDLY